MRKNSAAIRTHRHRGAHDYRAGARQRGAFLYTCLPGFCDVDAETPGFRSIHLITANHACELVIRLIKSMGVNRGGSRLQPDAGWWLCRLNSRTDGPN